jgi:hypothetical protein
MDVTIANLNISIHRHADGLRPELTISQAEREANRTAQIRRVEQERQQALNWYALHGGH